MARVGDVVVPLLKELELYGRCQAHRALVLWPEIVGPLVSQHTQPERIHHGTLFVRTSSSVWVHELTHGFRTSYLEALARHLGEHVITDIRFLPPPMRPSQASTNPQARLDLSGALSTAARTWISESTQHIADPELRQRFTRLLDKVARRRRAQERAGYQPCPGCQELNDDGTLCMRCRWSQASACRRAVHLLLREQPWITAMDVRAAIPGARYEDYSRAKQQQLQQLQRKLQGWCARARPGSLLSGESLQQALRYSMLRSGKTPLALKREDVVRSLGPELAAYYPKSAPSAPEANAG